MKTINTKQVLVNLKGEPLKNTGSNTDITIGQILSNVMGGRVMNPSLGWQLGKKFATEDTVELKAEEVVFVIKEIERVSIGDDVEVFWMNTILAGQLIEILDGKAEEKPKK